MASSTVRFSCFKRGSPLLEFISFIVSLAFVCFSRRRKSAGKPKSGAVMVRSFQGFGQKRGTRGSQVFNVLQDQNQRNLRTHFRIVERLAVLAKAHPLKKSQQPGRTVHEIELGVALTSLQIGRG